MFLMIAVRKVQTENIRSGFNEILNAFARVG
jgi:hypothetical protein